MAIIDRSHKAAAERRRQQEEEERLHERAVFQQWVEKRAEMARMKRERDHMAMHEYELRRHA